ncbi:MAG: hemerythrin domain-containing protein [Rhodobacteraceae bacterium]|nr:hemerythrin domain-containing protein [Paracoccaceae bacterium]MCF8516327.1 hemerythrin domain-containing protein [Paracoccaceae bacterium]MCF8520677.1 hemerythrin domain-containing protein [Paracoccaceae bacterium]
MTSHLDLSARKGLPDELRQLLTLFPREGWQKAPGFHGLAAFWLDRHLGFRSMLGMLAEEAEAMVDGKMPPERWRQRVSAIGGHLVQDLLGHHQIEDDAYFPQMVQLEKRLSHGFEILDRDHHALDGLLDGFVKGANKALQAKDARSAAGRFREGLVPFERQLIRHLEDEEDLIIPVILKHRMR